MKKNRIIIYIAVIALTFGILTAGKFGYQYYKDNYTVMTSLATEVDNVDEMREIIDSNETVYLYMGRPNCGDSDEFEEYFPDLMEEYDIDNLYYFNIMDLAKDNSNYKDILKEEFGLMYTPTLAKFENGELVLKSEWTPAIGYSKELTISFIEESGISD